MVYAKSNQLEKALDLMDAELNNPEWRNYEYKKFFPITVMSLIYFVFL